MIAVAVLAVVAAALLVGFILFFLYSRTPAWRTSEVRMATMRFLVIVGPFFGARVDMPEPTPTSISTPKDGPPDATTAASDGSHDDGPAAGGRAATVDPAAGEE